MKKILPLLFLIVFLSSCQSAQDAFTLKKKTSSDEFLVEKKSPLVMPPNYGELPSPDNQGPNEEKKELNEIKVTLSNNDLLNNETIKNSNPTSIEKSVLEKIK